jgi:hypothetical protein
VLKTTATYKTPVTVNLPSGEYQISMMKKVTKEKWRLPFVYVFTKWNDGVFAPSRRVLLDADLKLCAEFKVAFKASFILWAKIGFGVMVSTLNRFNEFYRKYPALFWLIGIILSLLSALSKFLKLLKIEELGDTHRGFKARLKALLFCTSPLRH